MKIASDSSPKSYVVGNRVAETETYRLYLCRPDGADRDHLLQVASSRDKNGNLDRSAYLLDKLTAEAERVEREYAREKKDPKRLLNYQFAFPEIIDSFISGEQGGRRINVLKFRGVDDVRTIVPLYNIAERDRRRVDLRTSVWIMGKLLKIIAFAHGMRIAVNDLGTGNVLIDPDQHYVIIFNWANARMESGEVPAASVEEDIRNAARSVLHVLGGTPDGGIPDDGTAAWADYSARITELATHGGQNAFQCHRAFYALVNSLWPRAFHPFTTFPR